MGIWYIPTYTEHRHSAFLLYNYTVFLYHAADNTFFSSLSFIKSVISDSDCICPPSGINNHYLKALQLNLMVPCTCCALIPHVWMCICWWQLLSRCINNSVMRCWQRQGAVHKPHSTRTGQKASVGAFKGTDVNESQVCTCARIFQASVNNTSHATSTRTVKRLRGRTITVFIRTNLNENRVPTSLTYPKCRAAVPRVENFYAAFSLLICGVLNPS